ncbi:cation:proton antiporter [Nocardioides sp. CER19]|uniref:cation:proton antiporter domain-containing protein n=1 Tax=Nocardioides sp. CER19 TaxID=3038538 RepID=UPI0024472DB5|nr:cation:proton antiporter [Nocardioides sp. CER19]MDH2416090.1 cation:proton antiporter [Nocardioides sp. CER19]
MSNTDTVLASLIVLGLFTMAWSLCATPLARLHLRVPVVMTLAGFAVGLFTHGRLADALNSNLTTRVAEIALATLLFVDATEVKRGQLLGNSAWWAARLLVVALPLSLAAALGIGLLLLPDLPWAALLVLACAVVPIDFAASESLLRDRRLPRRVRDALNVEGGYNDGIVSPIFAYALLIVGTTETSHRGGNFSTALGAVLVAVIVGTVLGAATGWLLAGAAQRRWTSARSAGVAVAVLPVLTYAIAIGCAGNGFVAAFVCGVTFRHVRLLALRAAPDGGSGTDNRIRETSSDHELLDDVVVLLSIAMWFVFGNVAVLVLTSGYIDTAVVVYSLAVLSVVRALPVMLALLGSDSQPKDRTLVALLGPRGTTSIVFGLLAFNQLADPGFAYEVLGVTTLVILGSVLLHGLLAPSLINRYANSITSSRQVKRSTPRSGAQ